MKKPERATSRKCLYCGKKFEPTLRQPRRGVCSSACARKNKKELVCTHCKKTFWPSHPGQKKFCSRACANKLHGKGRRLENLPASEEEEAWLDAGPQEIPDYS